MSGTTITTIKPSEVGTESVQSKDTAFLVSNLTTNKQGVPILASQASVLSRARKANSDATIADAIRSVKNESARELLRREAKGSTHPRKQIAKVARELGVAVAKSSTTKVRGTTTVATPAVATSRTKKADAQIAWDLAFEEAPQMAKKFAARVAYRLVMQDGLTPAEAAYAALGDTSALEAEVEKNRAKALATASA